ncbi:hypothetical protein K504DRAFT_459067 [Pleomassaria siparia CBS 279.74]|uniref:Uncharacterized protein n=1 Tax=Pleomassaria siparia CBS 279.74 TaxID=1314801 RepID=A0A6G1K2P5_9PLEO|nr:hypothetical protein K504DRAFT_459067 [Pleomassaria siparia CBS 279.74]
MDSDHLSPVSPPTTNDRFGARFNTRRDDSHIADQQPQHPFGDNFPISPPLPQQTFGATLEHRRDSDYHRPDALLPQNSIDPPVSPQDESFGTRTENAIRDVSPDRPYDPSYETPYDPPGDEAQIPMHHMDEPRSATITSPMSSMTNKKGDYGLVNQNTYDSDTRSLLSVAKKYDYHDSRKLLLKTGSYRFFITLVFCVLIALSLKAYEGFKEPLVINKEQVRIFNALMLGLSLGLGLNLASSLRRYAVILRWSLLTKRYVSLEVFDLILGLETLTNVGKLMVISLPGIRKMRFLKKLPWFRDARDDGTRFTWIVCLFWIIINIGAQILVAALSLFWPIDPSNASPILVYGNVTVSDLSRWATDPPGMAWNATALQAAWSYGNEATAYPVFPYNSSQTDLSSLAGTPLYQGDDGMYEYRFLSRNPEHLYTNYMLSTRKVQAKATCQQLETRGQYVTPASGPMYIMAKEQGKDFQEYYLPQRTTGSLSWIGAQFAYCGPRCTNFTVYQDSDQEEIAQPSLFLCENVLSPIEGGENDFDNLKEEDKKHIYSNDEFARIAAGAIAWTGYDLDGWDDRQTRSYLRGSKWSPYPTITKAQVEDLLARYTIGAIAAFDDHGLLYNVTNTNKRPVQGQQLTVDWIWVLSLLGAICFIQFVALMTLISFANNSIIRDESFFSLAMLLRPVVNRIGKEGMNMSGDEIKNHPKLRWKKIRYDYREGQNGEPNQVDIFFQGKDMMDSRRSWASGLYT